MLIGMAALASVGVSAPSALATDTLPWEGDRAAAPHQPYQRAYNPDQILAWDPSTDPDAPLLRSRIPLRPRVAEEPRAQRRPDLPASTQSLVLAGDYGNAFFESHPYTDVFAQHLFEYWQYTDVYAPWHGMAALGTPPELYRPDEEWTQRWFEFGAMNLPNPGYTDAAHRNGALSLGTVFFSDNDRGSQSFEEMLVRDDDGGFPIAEKLIAMADYFGFDGYFVNQEQVSVTMTRDEITEYREFLKALREGGLYVQWYDSVTDAGSISYQNEFNAANSPWVTNEEQGQIADSIFLNYWWNHRRLMDSALHAEELGLDPHDAVFAGVEAGMYQFEQPYDLRDNLDENGAPLNAIAALGADFTHSDFEGKTDNDQQHAAFDRARRWWTGTEDGAGEASEDAWQGMSSFITERSAITGTTFHTRFCTGHGLGFWRDGAQVSSAEWGNIGVQDLPVTWQWWFEGDGALQADYDYGPEAVSAPRFSYEPVGAFEGGSSLVIEGTLDGDARLRLFRTELEVTDSTRLEIVAQVPQGSVELTAAIALASDPSTMIELPVAFDGASGWENGTAELGEFAGQTITGVGIALHTPQEQRVQVNVGALGVAPAETRAPKRPRHFELAQALTATGELTLGWTLDEFSAVSRYEVHADGEYIGGIYNDALYVKDFGGTAGTLTLEAVGHDGQRSRPATIEYDLESGPGEVFTEVSEDEIVVSWTTPSRPGTAVTLTELEAGDSAYRAKVIATKGSTSATFSGAPVSGARFRATVDDRHATPASAISTFADAEISAYPASFAQIEGTQLVLRRPVQNDWNTLAILEDDVPLQFDTTYSQGLRDEWIRGRATRQSLTQELASTSSHVVARLTDYAGNTVETVLRHG